MPTWLANCLRGRRRIVERDLELAKSLSALASGVRGVDSPLRFEEERGDFLVGAGAVLAGHFFPLPAKRLAERVITPAPVRGRPLRP